MTVPPRTLETPGKPRPRQARALETRERLIRTGRAAFARLGHDGVNLARDVLAPAGVSVGSFYHQFADKTELLLAILHDTADSRRAAVISRGARASGAGSLDEALGLAWRAFLASLDEDEDGWRLNFSDGSSDERVRATVVAGREQWVAELTDFLGQWSPADERRRRAVAWTLVGLATGVGILYLDLTPEQRRIQRPTFEHDALAFTIGGVKGTLVPDNS